MRRLGILTGGHQIADADQLCAGRCSLWTRHRPHPAALGGAHASPDGSFKIYELPEPYPAVAYVSSPAGAIYVEAEKAERLMLKFDGIHRDALESDKSVELIASVAEELG
ncbi:Scr1 family TA system antitoxin-like transcriptional regulator [Sphaerisporangium sp. NPDC088356]|uniref:Scr1 family TA system antitoxin-like transcriptional regulator n=1 Tax=Sphaerisporangium sp. NPDC088356 TaxID=3154871 RepID=UPI00341CF722